MFFKNKNYGYRNSNRNSPMYVGGGRYEIDGRVYYLTDNGEWFETGESYRPGDRWSDGE